MDNWNPNYGGKTEYKKKLHFGFNKEVNSITFRILPQPKGVKYGTAEYKAVSFNNTWHKFHSTIFGYKNTEGKHRSFESPLVKNNKTKTVETPCAATDFINTLKAKLEEARATGNAAVQPKLNALVGLKGVYSVDNNQHMNVILLDGTIGELKLRHKAFLALRAEIDKLRTGNPDEPGFDPLSFNNGRFFTVTRSNTGRETTFNVSVYKEKVEVAGYGKLEKALVHTITPEILARLETEGYDLENIHLKVTSQECAQIVSEADLMSGKSPACNRIFDDRWKAKREANKASAEQEASYTPDEGPEETYTAPASIQETAVTAKLPQPVTATVTAVPTAVVTPVNTAASVSSGPTTVTATVTPKPTQAQVINEMSDDEWRKMLGIEKEATA